MSVLTARNLVEPNASRAWKLASTRAPFCFRIFYPFLPDYRRLSLLLHHLSTSDDGELYNLNITYGPYIIHIEEP